MAQLRTGRNLAPEVEALEKPDRLRPAVSPQDIRSYDEKRADWVAQPNRGGGLFGQLADALSGYVPVLDRWNAVKEQRFREEQTAEGKRLMQENKANWKDFIAKNPEYAGLNPHLERGYKTAHLENKAQDYAAALQDHYTTSGLMSETDPEKVRKAMDEFAKDWIKGNISREEFADSDIYNEAFYQKAVSAEAALMGRHTSDKAREHLRRAEDSFITRLTQIMDDGLMNAPGDPDGFDAALGGMAGQFQEVIEEMVASGVPLSVAHEWAEKAILANAKAYGGEKSGDLGPRLLPLLDKVMTGDGPLGAKATNKAAVAMQKKQWENDRRQADSHGIQMWHFQKARAEQASLEALGKEFQDKFSRGEVLTEAEAFKLIKPGQEALAISFVQRSQATVQWNQENQRQFELDKLAILNGQMTPTQAAERFGKYPPEKVGDLMDLSHKVQSGNDPVAKALSGDDMRRAQAQLAAQMGTTFPSGQQDYGGVHAAYSTEAAVLLNDETAVFVEGRTKKDGQAPSAAEIRLFIQEKATEIGRMYVQRKAELEAEQAANPASIIIKTPEEVRSSFDAGRLFYEPAWGRPDDKDRGSENMTQAVDTLTLAVRNPGTAAPLFMNRFGLTAEQVAPFIQSQLRMYGLTASDLLPERESKKGQPLRVPPEPQWPHGTPY